MSIVAQISRSRSNEPVYAYYNIEDLPTALESSKTNDHITIQPGDYRDISFTMPSDVYMTALPGALLDFNKISGHIQNIYDFNAYAEIDDHYLRNDNPHNVTAEHVGNSVAQWNANKIDNIDVNIDNLLGNSVLYYDITSSSIQLGLISADSMLFDPTNTSLSSTTMQSAIEEIDSIISDVFNKDIVINGNLTVLGGVFAQAISETGGFQLPNDTTILGDVSISGDLTVDGLIYGTVVQPSDDRLKKDISLIDASVELDKVLQLQPSEYIEIDSNKKNKGLLASHVQNILPEYVEKRSDGYLGINYARIVTSLISCVHVLQKELSTLHEEIRILKETI